MCEHMHAHMCVVVHGAWVHAEAREEDTECPVLSLSILPLGDQVSH